MDLLGHQLLVASVNGDAEAVARLLSRGAPMTTADRCDRDPLGAAADGGHLEVMQLLLAAGASPTRLCCRGRPALFWAAMAERNSEQAVRLLLQAAPSVAAQRDFGGNAPVFFAAAHANAAAVRALCEAAPAAVPPLEGQLCPLERVLWVAQWRHSRPYTARDTLAGALDTAHVLLPYLPPSQVLADLAQYHASLGALLHPLYAALAARGPLTTEQWRLLPAPCDGLAALLPAVLRRSVAEAALLVPHLPAADRRRLRAAALALHRSQARLRLHLPGELAGRILALALA